MTNTQIISTLIILVGVVLFIVCYRWVLRIIGVVIIPQNGIGVVTKKFVLFGQHKILADGEIVALKGEAGLQADALAPGLHFWLWPWQCSIHIEPFIEIEEGLIGIVEAAGGKPISGGRVIGNAVACDSFQSVRDFIRKAASADRRWR